MRHPSFLSVFSGSDNRLCMRLKFGLGIARRPGSVRRPKGAGVAGGPLCGP
jgi:hypothetical protein